MEAPAIAGFMFCDHVPTTANRLMLRNKLLARLCRDNSRTTSALIRHHGIEFSPVDPFDKLKPPASIRITHRDIDWHLTSLILFALMCGLPIGQRHDVISHAEHVVIGVENVIG